MKGSSEGASTGSFQKRRGEREEEKHMGSGKRTITTKRFICSSRGRRKYWTKMLLS